MHFTGTVSSTVELIPSPNITGELSNEFLESVGIILENYVLYCSSKIITFSLLDFKDFKGTAMMFNLTFSNLINERENSLFIKCFNTFWVYLYVSECKYSDFHDLAFFKQNGETFFSTSSIGQITDSK